MNERIQKLAEQAEEWVCKNYPDAMDDNDEFHAQTMKKFAELIVKECIKKCKDHPSIIFKNEWDADAVAPDIVSRLESHFGVEE